MLTLLRCPDTSQLDNTRYLAMAADEIAGRDGDELLLVVACDPSLVDGSKTLSAVTEAAAGLERQGCTCRAGLLNRWPEDLDARSFVACAMPVPGRNLVLVSCPQELPVAFWDMLFLLQGSGYRTALLRPEFGPPLPAGDRRRFTGAGGLLLLDMSSLSASHNGNADRHRQARSIIEDSDQGVHLVAIGDVPDQQPPARPPDDWPLHHLLLGGLDDLLPERVSTAHRSRVRLSVRGPFSLIPLGLPPILLEAPAAVRPPIPKTPEPPSKEAGPATDPLTGTGSQTRAPATPDEAQAPPPPAQEPAAREPSSAPSPAAAMENVAAPAPIAETPSPAAGAPPPSKEAKASEYLINQLQRTLAAGVAAGAPGDVQRLCHWAIAFLESEVTDSGTGLDDQALICVDVACLLRGKGCSLEAVNVVAWFLCSRPETCWDPGYKGHGSFETALLLAWLSDHLQLLELAADGQELYERFEPRIAAARRHFGIGEWQPVLGYLARPRGMEGQPYYLGGHAQPPTAIDERQQELLAASFAFDGRYARLLHDDVEEYDEELVVLYEPLTAGAETE